MYLSVEKAEAILKLLLEGCSISTTARLTGAHISTIPKVLVKAGESANASWLKDLRDIQVRGVECDELWAFIGKEQKRVRPEGDPSSGNCYTFVAIERHRKLVLNIAADKRDQAPPIFSSRDCSMPLEANLRSRRTVSLLTALRSPRP